MKKKCCLNYTLILNIKTEILFFVNIGRYWILQMREILKCLNYAFTLNIKKKILNIGRYWILQIRKKCCLKYSLTQNIKHYVKSFRRSWCLVWELINPLCWAVEAALNPRQLDVATWPRPVPWRRGASQPWYARWPHLMKRPHETSYEYCRA